MSNQNLWEEKVAAFKILYYKKLDHEDSVKLLQNLHEVKLDAIVALLVTGESFTMDAFYGVCCTFLDNLSASWHGLPILSPLQREDDG